jgi:hypothetical protein
MMFAYAGPYGKLADSRVTNRFRAKNMSVLITLLVAGLVVVYLRSNSKARENWLQNLSLPGHWVSQRDGSHLSLAGSFDSGEFVRQGETSNDSGDWRYQGERLTLNGTHQQSFYRTDVSAGGDQPDRRRRHGGTLP